ncbi:hypothetical protein ACHAXT_011477 [Thalassiosira profunda]
MGKSSRRRGTPGAPNDASRCARGGGAAGGDTTQQAGGGEAGSGGSQTGGDRHKYAEHGNVCICGYKGCTGLLHDFYETEHVYGRRPVDFKVSSDPRFEPFLESLLRNLHVPDEKKREIRAKGAGCRFPVAAHHFTEEVVSHYLNNPKFRGVWKVRLDCKEASKFLRLPLDDRDRDKPEQGGKFFINANVTMDESRAALSLVRSERSTLQSAGRNVDDPEKEALRISLERKNEALAHEAAELKEARQTIDNLEREKQALKRKHRRTKKAKSELSSENEQLKEQQTNLTLDDVTRILLKVGGLNRLTLFDPEWHKENEGAASVLWGFNSFDEALVYVECFFPDVDTSQSPGLQRATRRKRQKGSHDPADEVKKSCLLCKLFFRRDLSEQFLALIFNKHRTTIGRLLKEWAPIMFSMRQGMLNNVLLSTGITSSNSV